MEGVASNKAGSSSQVKVLNSQRKQQEAVAATLIDGVQEGAEKTRAYQGSGQKINIPA